MVKLLSVAAMIWATTAIGPAIAAPSPKTSVQNQIDAPASGLATHRSVGSMSPERAAWFRQAVDHILQGK